MSAMPLAVSTYESTPYAQLAILVAKRKTEWNNFQFMPSLPSVHNGGMVLLYAFKHATCERAFGKDPR